MSDEDEKQSDARELIERRLIHASTLVQRVAQRWISVVEGDESYADCAMIEAELTGIVQKLQSIANIVRRWPNVPCEPDDAPLSS